MNIKASHPAYQTNRREAANVVITEITQTDRRLDLNILEQEQRFFGGFTVHAPIGTFGNGPLREAHTVEHIWRE